MSNFEANLAAPRGVLTVGIDGHWRADEFSVLFERLNKTYRRFAAAHAFIDATRAREPAPSWPAWFGYLDFDESISGLEASGEISYGPLVVATVSFASPGAAEVLGALNPLKVLEKGVTSWRHENTIRAQNQDAAQLENRRLDQEQQRTDDQRSRDDNQYVLDLLDRLADYPPALREALLAKLVLEPQQELRELARDRRVTDVEVKELGPTG